MLQILAVQLLAAHQQQNFDVNIDINVYSAMFFGVVKGIVPALKALFIRSSVCVPECTKLNIIACTCDAGYGHSVGALQAMSVIPVAIGM